jgi:hypothetical protein
MIPKPFALTWEEQSNLAHFLEGPAKKMLDKGAQWALVFSAGSGIGTSVTVTAKLGDEIFSEDITDYSDW